MLAPSPSRVLLAVALASATACAPGQAGPDPPTPAALAPEPEPEPPAPTPEAVLAPIDDPAPKPTTITFDPATATALRARIVALPNRKHWVPCGIHHSVGALEVEVLEAGEPPPRMLLFVSCPVDLRRGPKLAIGATISVKLHARKQSWPAVGGLPPELPRRYVASFAPE